MLNENIKRDNWNFIRYDVVETFYLENRNKDTVNSVEIEKLSKTPVLRKKQQPNVEKYC